MRTLRKLFVVALAASAVAVPALAQQPSGYPAACDASKVTKADSDRAHSVFLSGKQFLDESNYDKAISYFKDAYTIDCSVHAILPIIATAYERKGDKAEAVRALEEYLKRVPNAQDREVVERRIKNLKDQIGPVRPTATAPTATTPPTATTTAPTAPTATTSTATATSTTTAPTSTTTATGTGNPPPPPAGAHSTTPWIVAGAGGLLVGGGAVMLLVGSHDVSNAQSTCPTRTNCPADVASQGNTGRTLETVGVIAGGVGVAAVVGGLVWHFTEKPQGAPATGVRVTPAVAPGYAGIGVGGAF